MDGVVNIRKTAGPTSHDVVNEVRRLFGQRRVGHAGTLDPMATGVLVVCLGQATRIVEYITGAPKQYRARLVLGQETDTQDSTGVITAESDASAITEEMLENAAASFVGEIQQIPPMVSAIKHQGKPLYKLAREGKVVDRSPRAVTIYSIEVLNFVPGPRAEAEIMAECSSGTYIRTLCHDIGRMLGCGANMSALERTRIGRFNIADSVTVEQLTEAKSEGRLVDFVLPPAEALSDFPAIMVDADGESCVMHGMPVPSQTSYGAGSVIRILTQDGVLLGIGHAALTDNNTIVQPRKVFVEVRG